MTLRLEEKIFINNLNIFEFKKWLQKKKAITLFQPRLVNSVYYDNNFKMYLDSIEGITPRKKIRFRTYGTKNFLFTKNNIKKETKISFYNYRSKIVEKTNLTKNLLNYEIFDKNYGTCTPVLNVYYKRSYYQIENLRFTLDENINYSKISNSYISKFFLKDLQSIIEIKSNDINAKDILLKNFPLARSRFSKYCRGIELLKMF